jgi:hypothetical protein
MTIDTDALIKTLNGVDASRRAGWAKKYAADERAEELSRLVNILSEQRDDMRRALGWLFGVAMALGKDTYDGDLFAALQAEVNEWEVALDPEDIARGRQRSWEIDTQNGSTRANQVKYVKARRSMKNAARLRDVVEKRFARRYGFKDGRQFVAACDAAFGRHLPDETFESDVLREYEGKSQQLGYPVQFIDLDEGDQ